MLTIRLDKRAVEGMLNRLPREEVPFCTALALTRTAQSSKEVQIDEMKRVFDRPTRFTLNSLVVVRAEKTRLTAQVKFKDNPFSGTPADRYLMPQVEGGARREKGMEVLLRNKGILPPGKFVAPGRDARLDSSGNMSRGQVVQILSAVKALRDPLQNRGYGKRSLAKARINAVFVARDDRGVPKGIWARQGRKGRVRVLLAFVRRPSYTKRYRFYELGEAHANRVLPEEFGKAFDSVMKQRGLA